MYWPGLYGCNSDSKMTNEMCFFDLQEISNTEKRHGLNFAVGACMSIISLSQLKVNHMPPGKLVVYMY